MAQPTRALALTAAMCLSACYAQADSQPKFEVASIRRVGPPKPGAFQISGGPGSRNPERIIWAPIQLITVLERAYELPSQQISGPGWLKTDLFEIHAKIPPRTDARQFRLMLQSLLAERFHLTVHHATKEFPAYELVVAKGGPKMKPWRPDPAATAGSPMDAMFPTVDKEGFPVLLPSSKTLTATRGGMVRTTARVSMVSFADTLEMLVRMSTGSAVSPQVADKTGLRGEFELKLEFADAATGDGAAGEFGVGQGIFTALEQQLGLKLINARPVKMDLLVIDRVDRDPTEN
jgi:uncharacterized protein (TIGR03435 family)